MEVNRNCEFMMVATLIVNPDAAKVQIVELAYLSVLD